MRPEMMPTADIETLIALAEMMAVSRKDGHLTILRFTNGWKCVLGTPLMDYEGRKDIAALDSFQTLREALVDLILSRYAYDEQ